MNLAITGASGFLGRHLIQAALDRGHDVTAIVRPASRLTDLAWADDPRVKIARIDLRAPAGLAAAIEGADVVVHAAAGTSGDFHGRFASTVIATENLLGAMQEAGVRRIVLISSFAVYDYLGRWSWSTLDEDSPLESRPEGRGAYAHTKLIQENYVRREATTNNLECTIIRPGAVYGPGRLWTTRLGIKLSNRWWLRLGAWAPVPLTHVENCAEATILAAERDEAIGETLNIVDDETPSQRMYMRMLQRLQSPRPRVIPVSYTVMRILARIAHLTNRVMFKGQGKFPAVLIPASLHAGSKPLRYPNDRAKRVLGWAPRWSLSEGVERSLSPTPPESAPSGRATGQPSTRTVSTTATSR